MSLAKEETKTIYRAVDGIAYNTKRLAEVNSVAHITGFGYEIEHLDLILKELVGHYDLRTWLLGQIAEQAQASRDNKPKEVRLQDINEVCDLPSNLAEYGDRDGRDKAIMREIGIRMEHDGYRLIKL